MANGKNGCIADAPLLLIQLVKWWPSASTKNLILSFMKSFVRRPLRIKNNQITFTNYKNFPVVNNKDGLVRQKIITYILSIVLLENMSGFVWVCYIRLV